MLARLGLVSRATDVGCTESGENHLLVGEEMGKAMVDLLRGNE